jgi:hypothetical protein
MASSAGDIAASAASMPAATFLAALLRLVRLAGLMVGCFLTAGFGCGFGGWFGSWRLQAWQLAWRGGLRRGQAGGGQQCDGAQGGSKREKSVFHGAFVQ